ncbi:MAG: hypothetical protein IJS17_05170 [Clostridia bacterium]|nr:hypothetical protein [Clostridia bacterium]
MKTTIISLLLVAATVIIFASAFLAVKKRFEGKPAKRALRINLAAFAVMAVMVSVFTITSFAANDPAPDAAATQAQTQTEETEETSGSSHGIGLLAAGLATGLAGIGGGIAVAAGAPSAISATSENPKAFGKAIIFVALGESIALYGVVISILILSNL